MNYQYIKDSDGKVTDILINGKPIKPSYRRAFVNAQKAPYFRIIENDCIATNPFSGVQVPLNPLESTIYAFCMRWYNAYTCNPRTSVSVSVYDNMKYFLLSINPQAYYDLID